MGMLDGQIKKAIAAGFKGKLLKGSLVRQVRSSTKDEYGDPVSTTPTTFKFEGLRENWSSFFRTSVGINDTDVGILIIAGSTNTQPQKDDVITLSGKEMVVRKIAEIDPAGATYRVACYER